MKTKAISLTCALVALFSVRAAHAAVIMTLEQVGSNVVATGSGTVNLTGLSFLQNSGLGLVIRPGFGLLVEGNPSELDVYNPISGPTNFGPGGATFASTGTGDPLGIFVATGGQIFVPHGYVSGTPLSSTATWNATTLSALGVTDGIYTWTWGTGANADSLTLYAGVPVPVPEPAPALLLTLGAATLALLKRVRK